jgi:choline dehydrogenase-like flavoprotein
LGPDFTTPATQAPGDTVAFKLRVRSLNADRGLHARSGRIRLDRYQSTHITGGAVTGDDPASSVLNSYGQIWDVPSLFVTGAALYPQNAAANPTGTLAALAYRTGDAIRDRFDGDLIEAE